MNEIEVLRPGPLTTVQDMGRPGLAALGVGASGAADRRSASLANRLVGNPDGAACLESTFGGLALRFRHRTHVAITGAPCPITRNGRGEAMNAPFTVGPGEDVVLGPPSSGLRTYVAVRGGIGVEPTLESRATDLLSGLGPPALSAGDVLPVGGAITGPLPAVSVAPVADPPRTGLSVRVLPGPRDDWFTPGALQVLGNSRYTVTSESNRVGVRLDGPKLTWDRQEELPSEGMVIGAIQVPPSGLPVLFLADHPVTGGYPVIAVVVSEDLPVVAQACPGQAMTFRVVQRTVPAT
ncbi:biotin-dependent carboxyltransferase family protein [Amycolatopsis sp.]|uniref:5-oxoprolinase subunit C family protein n=1 Tax=Amycolatopsis sp. TaxID=37632 RepID=UPI002C0CE7AA|nr:biotin-dependent carboxyltransferase family protein [Amycolatopsis sp.]HVV09938.1 biotin-dependent carboxyltransferase family protein [Amycolatopsis sp.]